MRKKHVFAGMLFVLLVALAGCKPNLDHIEANIVHLSEPEFQGYGFLIWLYQDANGRVGMFTGTYKDVSTLVQEATLLGSFDAGIQGGGKGHWTSNRTVKRDLLVYVSAATLEGDFVEQIKADPDHVIYVDLAGLKPQMAVVGSEVEYEELRREFAATVAQLSQEAGLR